ncbi:unnamed protein product, partial [Polarella glacialis]
MAVAFAAQGIQAGPDGDLSGMPNLLRMLIPKTGATPEEEQMRASIIMQHASKGPRISEEDLESTYSIDQETADRLKALRILQGVFGGTAAGALDLGPSPRPSSPRLRSVPEAISYDGVWDDAPSPSCSSSSLAGLPLTKLEPKGVVCDAAAPSPGGCPAVHELQVKVEPLPKPIRLLEAVDSVEATRSYRSIGE